MKWLSLYVCERVAESVYRDRDFGKEYLYIDEDIIDLDSVGLAGEYHALGVEALIGGDLADKVLPVKLEEGLSPRQSNGAIFADGIRRHEGNCVAGILPKKLI